MRKRTLSREAALKILYASDVTKESIEESCRKFWENNRVSSEDIKSFSEELVFGFEKQRENIDRTITSFAKNWALDRMASIDRSILRLASFELLYERETPPKVVINEAVELAKKYGDRDSGKFVNGILDKIKSEVEVSRDDDRE